MERNTRIRIHLIEMRTLTTLVLIGLAPLLSFAQSAEDYFQKGESLYNDAMYEQAIPLFDLALKSDPGHMNSYLRRGFCYSMIERFDAAVADFSKIIEAHPEHVWAYLSRGSALNKQKKYKEAMADYDRVLSLEPKNTEAYNNRGWCKKWLADTDGACADWNTSKRLGSEEAKIILKNNHCK